MNYDKVSPSSQSPKNEAITQISIRLINDFPPSDRIQIMKEVETKLLHDLYLHLEESDLLRKQHQSNLDEFERAFGYEQAETSSGDELLTQEFERQRARYVSPLGKGLPNTLNNR